jgi:hypothetical protein
VEESVIKVIEALLSGDESVARCFEASRAYWSEFFQQNRNLSIDDLARKLGDAQREIEEIFDSARALGKDAMVVTCIGSLYSTVEGFADNSELARRVIQAFPRSACSQDVKQSVQDAVALYFVAPIKRP